MDPYTLQHRAMGHANVHRCALQYDDICDGQAHAWALDWSKVKRKDLREHEGKYYSIHEDDYIPACLRCHSRFDAAVRAARGLRPVG
jgi:hypothetical protein